MFGETKNDTLIRIYKNLRFSCCCFCIYALIWLHKFWVYFDSLYLHYHYHCFCLYSSANSLTLFSEARSIFITTIWALDLSWRILFLHSFADSMFLQAITTWAPWKASDLTVSYPVRQTQIYSYLFWSSLRKGKQQKYTYNIGNFDEITFPAKQVMVSV